MPPTLAPVCRWNVLALHSKINYYLISRLSLTASAAPHLASQGARENPFREPPHELNFPSRDCDKKKVIEKARKQIKEISKRHMLSPLCWQPSTSPLIEINYVLRCVRVAEMETCWGERRRLGVHKEKSFASELSARRGKWAALISESVALQSALNAQYCSTLSLPFFVHCRLIVP